MYGLWYLSDIDIPKTAFICTHVRVLHSAPVECSRHLVVLLSLEILNLKLPFGRTVPSITFISEFMVTLDSETAMLFSLNMTVLVASQVTLSESMSIRVVISMPWPPRKLIRPLTRPWMFIVSTTLQSMSDILLTMYVGTVVTIVVNPG